MGSSTLLIVSILSATKRPFAVVFKMRFPWLICTFPIRERRSGILFLASNSLFFWEAVWIALSSFPVWVLYQYNHMASGISFQVKKSPDLCGLCVWTSKFKLCIAVNTMIDVNAWTHWYYHAFGNSCLSLSMTKRFSKTEDWIRIPIVVIYVACCLFIFLDRVLLCSWLAWNFLCRPVWSWTHRDPPVLLLKCCD